MMTSQVIKSVNFTKAQRYLGNKIFFLHVKNMGISKPCTHLHPTHFSLHPALCNNLYVIRTKILHVIGQFPQFSLKHSKSSISLKIGLHSLLEELRLNLHLNFSKFYPKIHFRANLDQKKESQSCPFCVKTGTHDILRMLILIRTVVFWIYNPISVFGQIWTKKVKIVRFD